MISEESCLKFIRNNVCDSSLSTSDYSVDTSLITVLFFMILLINVFWCILHANEAVFLVARGLEINHDAQPASSQLL